MTAARGKGDAFFYVVVGAPGSGKSSQIKLTLDELRAPRLLIWDVEREYSPHGVVVHRMQAFYQAMVGVKAGEPVRLVFQPNADDAPRLRVYFALFCQIAFYAGDVLVVVDELADVDSPNPADVVPAWALLLRRGRKRGVRVIAGTQRPADVNKRLWSFATRLRVGRLQYASDQRELANALTVERAEVARLADTDWIERDTFKGTITRGRIAWRRGRPVNLLAG